MTKNKTKKDDKVIKSEKEILSGTLEDNHAYTLTIGIPGRGKINIKITFYISLTFFNFSSLFCAS